MREVHLIEREDARETAVVAATVIAVALAKIYWISRVGFDNPIMPVVSALGLSLFLVAAPLWIARYAGRGGRAVWWRSQSFIALGCIAITMLAGMLAGASELSVAAVFAVAGFVLAGWTFVRWLKRGSILRSLAFVLCVGVFAVWCAGVIWGSRYKMPLFWETMSFNANIHHDTFYYASIANMLDTYGVPSTGIDGIPIIRYHYGSPWLFDQWSHLLDVDVLSFYSLGYPVIVLPLFFAALLQLSADVGAKLRGDWRAWIVFLAATVGFIPTVALDALAVWNSNAFISESYLIGMPVFFFALGTGLSFWRHRGGKSSQLIFLLLFVPAILSSLGFLKISLMILALAAALYTAFRLGIFREPAVVVSILLSAAAVGVTYPLVSLPAQNGGISPLHFMRFDAAQGWQQFFPLIHFLWTWVYVAGRLWEEGVRDLTALRAAIKSRRLIDAELLLVLAVLGFLPGEIISIHGGSAVYFSDVQRWLALSLIMGRVALWASQWRERHPRTAVNGVRLSTVLLVFIAAPFVATLFINLAQWPARFARSNFTTRREIAAAPRDSTYYPIVTALRDIARLPEAQRRQTALFIPQSSHQYWSMFTADGRCTFTPLIAPAIASVALIDGTPPAGCEMTDQYNMTSYSPRPRPQLPQDTEDQTLCAKARAKGFRQVIVLDAPRNEVPRRRRIDCYLHTS